MPASACKFVSLSGTLSSLATMVGTSPIIVRSTIGFESSLLGFFCMVVCTTIYFLADVPPDVTALSIVRGLIFSAPNIHGTLSKISTNFVFIFLLLFYLWYIGFIKRIQLNKLKCNGISSISTL